MFVCILLELAVVHTVFQQHTDADAATKATCLRKWAPFSES